MDNDLKERHLPMEIDRETKMIADLEKAGRQDIADIFREQLDAKLLVYNSKEWK